MISKLYYNKCIHIEQKEEMGWPSRNSFRKRRQLLPLQLQLPIPEVVEDLMVATTEETATETVEVTEELAELDVEKDEEVTDHRKFFLNIRLDQLFGNFHCLFLSFSDCFLGDNDLKFFDDLCFLNSFFFSNCFFNSFCYFVSASRRRSGRCCLGWNDDIHRLLIDSFYCHFLSTLFDSIYYFFGD